MTKPSIDVHADCRAKIGALEAALADAREGMEELFAELIDWRPFEEVEHYLGYIDRARWTLGEGP